MPDYWGKDLPVNAGRYNFDTERYEYFRDGTVLVEALKGDLYDFRVENIARNWATAYDDFPAVKEGRLIKEAFPDRGMGIMQAFVFNTRRDKFKDPRVRRAFNLAMNYEEMNKALFYGLYKRINSYFFGSELASSGLPEGDEKAILESVKDKVPASVFTDALHEPGQRQPRGRAQEPARGRRPAARGGLRAARRQDGQQGHGRAADRRVPGIPEHLRAGDPAVLGPAEAHRHRRRPCG